MRYVDNIRHASEYMLSLVDTLMEFYLLDSGQLQHHPSIFHLGTLLGRQPTATPRPPRRNISASPPASPDWTWWSEARRGSSNRW